MSNGLKLFPNPVDGRSAVGRRFKDLIADIGSDLGGWEQLSEGQRQFTRRASLLSSVCEKMEAEAVQELAEFDIDKYGMLCDRLGRLMDRLGLKRVAKPTQNAVIDHFERRP